jgi:hypothetical protein
MYGVPDLVWSPNLCELLKKCWEVEGYTASRTALEFQLLGYNVTKNAIIGKVNRLQLTSPVKKRKMLSERDRQVYKATNAIRKKGPVTARDKKRKPPRALNTAMSRANPNGSHNIHILHAKDNQCKFIVGYIEGRCSDAIYCGAPVTVVMTSSGYPMKVSYCEHHTALCITPAARGKR